MHTHRSFWGISRAPVILLDLLAHLHQNWVQNGSVGRDGHRAICSTTSFPGNKASWGFSQRSQVYIARSMTDDEPSWKYFWEEREEVRVFVLIPLLPEVLFQENQHKFCLQPARGSSWMRGGQERRALQGSATSCQLLLGLVQCQFQST